MIFRRSNLMTGAIAVLLLGASAGSAGCAGPRPLDDELLPGGRWSPVIEAYRAGVERLHASDDQTWRSGWLGNMAVNAADDPAVRGLCWEWQEAIYLLVHDEAQRAGLALVGVQKNRETAREHNAVIVFDPAVRAREHLLAGPPPRHGLVLDAWRTGRAEVYALDDWLGEPRSWRTPPRLEDLGYLDGRAPAPTPYARPR